MQYNSLPKRHKQGFCRVKADQPSKMLDYGTWSTILVQLFLFKYFRKGKFEDVDQLEIGC